MLTAPPTAPARVTYKCYLFNWIVGNIALCKTQITGSYHSLDLEGFIFLLMSLTIALIVTRGGRAMAPGQISYQKNIENY